MVIIPKHTLTLKAYQAGKPISELAREKNLSRIVKLASNENPLGPSPKAMAAVSRAVAELHRYVDPRSTETVAAIAGRFGRKPSEIICASGTDTLLAYIINGFTSEQDELLTSEGSFIGIYVNTKKLARKLRLVPLKEYAFDLETLAESISENTRIVYLANPNNPTGTMFTGDRFEAFMKRVPPEVLVILDEAYAEYAAEHDGYPDSLRYHYENVIVTRSLSKACGLAGLRVGFAVGPEYLIDVLYKVRLPFEPNRLAQVAMVAALTDDEHRSRTIETNHRSLTRLIACFDSLHIRYVKTVANFILLLLPSEEHADRFFRRCLDHGLIVRPVKPFGITNGIRISSGSDDDTIFAVNVIERVWADIMKPVEVKTFK
ncbi:MAG: histidinol-phosphate transaminase [bacterium]